MFRIRWICELLCICVLVAGCSIPEQTTSEAPIADAKAYNEVAIDLFYQRGKSALSEKRYLLAIESYRHALQRDPRNMRSRLGLGEAYLAVSKSDAALLQFRTVLNLLETGVLDIEADGNASDGASANKAVPGETKAKLAGAADARPSAPEVTLDDAERQELRALTLQGIGLATLRGSDRQSASDVLSEAVALNPGLWRSWLGLARIYDFERRWDLAQTAYERAISIAPKESSPYNNLGMSRLAAGDFDSAEQAFVDALKRDRTSKVIKANLRLTLAWQGKYENALAGAKRQDRAKILNNVGFIALMRTDYAKSQQLLLEAIESSSTYFVEARKNLEVAERLANNGKTTEGTR